MIRTLFRITLPLLILGGCGAAGWWFYTHQPVQAVMEAEPSLVRVEATTLRRSDYTVVAHSQGTVQPQRRTVLTAEVGGRVMAISPHFRPGHFFEEGEVLVRLDPVDYEAALVETRAVLAQAQALLVDEKAKAEQAVDGWKALGRTGEPGPLLTRAHQVAKAEADVAAAEARLKKAQRDLERTELRAPYSGQVMRQAVDLGQVIAAGADLGEVIGVEVVEVRLPLPEREAPYLKMPHFRRDQKVGESGAEVRFMAQGGLRPVLWKGKLVRVEGAVDEATRQAIAVAEIRRPFDYREDGAAPLKVGQFLEADIVGQPLKNVLVLPRQAVRAGNEIILITKENRLRLMKVEPLAADTRHVVIAEGLPGGPRDGDVLCVTPIPFPAEGARVLPSLDGRAEKPGMAGTERPDSAASAPPVSKDKDPGRRGES